ncbi:MAG: TetR/AcrR family transcriptional regulator [Acidimicrobiia bacterium]
MGTAERRAREREARRRAILDATRELVREHGFNGTTTRQIAELCELSEATLFFYFSSKDEILISLLEEACQYWADGLASLLSTDGDSQQKLADVWSFFGDVQREHPEYVHVSTYLAQPQSTTSVDADVMANLKKLTGENFLRLADLMAELDGVANPRLAADVLWSTFLGLMVLRQSRTNLGAPEHPTPAGLVAALGLLEKGLSPPGTSQ